jgi:hypothetical protein
MNWFKSNAQHLDAVERNIMRTLVPVHYDVHRLVGGLLDKQRTDNHIRLQCLGLAVRFDHGDPVETAGRMFAFVTGEAAKTPRQLIDAALETANVT